jgi:hypothetical protein
MYLCMFEGEMLDDGARCVVGSIPEVLGGLAFSHGAGRGFFGHIIAMHAVACTLKKIHMIKKKKKKKK